MTDRIKPAFDCIYAEDALKEKTLSFLRTEAGKKRKSGTRVPIKGFAVSFALLVLVVLTGIFSYSLYFTENAYIDFDVNPSVELAVNRFDRVVGVHAYNSDGESIIKGLNIKYKKYEDAISSLLGAVAQKGYLKGDGLVSVTLQTNDSGRESEMLSGLAKYVEANVYKHHGSAQIDVFPVSGEVRDGAHELNLSPAKYLAIMELQEFDPSASVETCRNHTIGELKSLTRMHGRGHHTQSSPYTQNTQPHHDAAAGRCGHG